MTTSDNRELAQQFRSVADDLGVSRADLPAAMEPVASRRRARGRRRQEPSGIMAISDVDGVLRVDDNQRARLGSMTGRRAARSATLGGEVIQEIPFEHLTRGQIPTALARLDDKLTPVTGLRELKSNRLVPVAQPAETGRILLFVHGTFSNNDTLLEQLKRTQAGRNFLGRAAAGGGYDQILTFDHPTLGVSPILNARELALNMGRSRADVDVICHSRGGLVTRWWLEAFDRAAANRRRAIFVGAPLAGTGLAAPPNLRATLSLLANIGRALGAGAAAVPFLAVTTGLFQVFSSVTRLLAKTPVVDAAIALVPGLNAMSRIGNQPEILSLRQSSPRVQSRYYSVQSNFEPDAVGWRFWKAFRNLKSRVADTAADVIFDGANDLVVDTVSMTDLGPEDKQKIARVHDFGSNSKVHHTNYFSQRETIEFFESVLFTKP